MVTLTYAEAFGLKVKKLQLESDFGIILIGKTTYGRVVPCCPTYSHRTLGGQGEECGVKVCYVKARHADFVMFCSEQL